jgi:hypothetical protein
MTAIWSVQSLRLSLFTAAQISTAEAEWTKVTSQEEAHVRQIVPGGRVYGGLVGETYLTLSVVNSKPSGGRADLIRSPSPTEAPEPAMLRVIGKWEAERDRFISLALSWLKAFESPIIRIAFGAALFSQVSDRKECYILLSKLLKSVAVIPDQMRDLLFRINWPEESHVLPGLSINRLTTWASMKRWPAAVILTGDQLSVGTDGDEVYAVSLEIDNNTDQEHTQPFDEAQKVAIFKELVAMATTNASDGERP